MSTLRDYLDERIGELEKQILAKHNEMRSLQTELVEARRALAAITRQPTAQGRRRGRHSSPYPESIKVMVRKVLTEAVEPISADTIQESIARVFGADVVRTTLSPQISRLVASGEVLMVGGLYTLAQLEES